MTGLLWDKLYFPYLPDLSYWKSTKSMVNLTTQKSRNWSHQWEEIVSARNLHGTLRNLSTKTVYQEKIIFYNKESTLTGIVRNKNRFKSVNRSSVSSKNINRFKNRCQPTFLDLANKSILKETIVTITNKPQLSKESNKSTSHLTNKSLKESYIKAHIQSTRLLTNQLKALSKTFKRFNRSQEFLTES